MKECVEKIKRANPEFKHHLFDNTERRNFIEQNFEPKVLEAYDALIPGAYRADLWRYCVLYKLGGIYLDIKFEPIGDFKFIELCDKEYWVVDRPYALSDATAEHNLYLVNHPRYLEYVSPKISTVYWKNKKIGVYNALIICKPKNKLLKQCIDQVVQNVQRHFYGHNCLYPTGPGMISELMSEKQYKSFIRNAELFNSLCGNKIYSKQKPILKHYAEYRNEQKQCASDRLLTHYPDCWLNKKVYKTILSSQTNQLLTLSDTTTVPV